MDIKTNNRLKLKHFYFLIQNFFILKLLQKELVKYNIFQTKLQYLLKTIFKFNHENSLLENIINFLF